MNPELRSVWAGCMALTLAAWASASEPVTRRVVLTEPRVPLRRIAAEIERQTGTPIKLSDEIATDPLSVILKDRTAEDAVSAIADVMHYRLRKRANGAVELSLDPAWATLVSRLDTQMAERDRREETARVDALMAGLEGLVAKQDRPEGGAPSEMQRALDRAVGQWIAGLGSEARQALALAASQEIGVIGAGSRNSHMADRTLFFQPVLSAPAAVRELLQASAAQDPGLAETVGSEGAVVGISTFPGAVGLTLYAGGRYVNLGAAGIGSSRFTAVQSRQTQDRAEWARQLEIPTRADRRWLDPGKQPLPAVTVRSWRSVPFSWTADPRADPRFRTAEDAGLALLAEKGGLELVSDAWADSLLSTRSATAELLAVPADTAASWARRFAAAHGKLYRAVGNRLLLRSNRVLWSRWVEPPPLTVEALRASVRKNGRLNFGDYLAHAEVINAHRAPVLAVLPETDGIQFRREAIFFRGEPRLFGLLQRHRVPERGENASAESGNADFSRVEPAERIRFLKLLWTGLPIPTERRAQPLRDLHAEWKTRGDLVEIEFEDAQRKLLTRRSFPLPPRRIERPAPAAAPSKFGR